MAEPVGAVAVPDEVVAAVPEVAAAAAAAASEGVK